MKIVHVCTSNPKIFEDALSDTGCKVNGSSNLEYLRGSIFNFNARDTMGLVIFRKNLTKKILNLIKSFDNLMHFHPLPIIVVCDDAVELSSQGKIKVRNCPLFCINSMDGTISDVDIKRIFTTLACSSGEMYELKEIEEAFKQKHAKKSETSTPEGVSHVAKEILTELSRLEREGI